MRRKKKGEEKEEEKKRRKKKRKEGKGKARKRRGSTRKIQEERNGFEDIILTRTQKTKQTAHPLLGAVKGGI